MNPDLEFAIETVQRAGALILSYFNRDYRVDQKSENNPVTTADRAADTLLHKAFAEKFPEDGWMSEESADTPDRLARRRVWVVDPLDGTREFVQGLHEFAVSVALVEDRAPSLAVVYNPPRDDLFTAELGNGALRRGSPIRISPCQDLVGARILASRSEYAEQFFDDLKEWGKVRTLGSIAYKLALVAAQEADLTFSFRPKNEWDVCAGSLLVREAGGVITDLDGGPLMFNKPDPLIHGIIAANSIVHAQVLQTILPRLRGRLH